MDKIKPVITIGDKKLVSKSKKIRKFDDSLKQLVKNMVATMNEYQGAGLSAVQIGELRRVAVIRDIDGSGLLVLINPEITQQSGQRVLQEGCLSIPDKWGYVNRPEAISVKAQDANGKIFRINNATGLLAQVLAHEIDHMDGFLYIRRLAVEQNVSKLD